MSGGKVFSVSSVALFHELGVGRQTKHRTLRHLEGAGIIAVHRQGKRGVKVSLIQVQ